MSELFFVLFLILIGVTITSITITIVNISTTFYNRFRRCLPSIIISLVLIVVTLLPFIPYVTVSDTIINKLPNVGVVEITLENEDTFVDKANSRVEKFISKYVSKEDVDIELDCYLGRYAINIKNKDGETLDYYATRDRFDIYMLLRDSTLLNS